MKKPSLFTTIVTLIVVVDLFLVYQIFDYPTAESPAPSPLKTLMPSATPRFTPVASKNPSPTPKPSPGNQNIINLNVPFSAQAPFGEWEDPRQQDGCEEASLVMAMAWVRGKAFTLQEAKQSITEMADWELANYGFFQDTSATDTAKLMREYYRHTNLEVRKNIDTDDILAELEKGNLVIIPSNGQRLNNPNFTNGGPPVHMLVVKGYDYTSKEFITNDPGTRKGADYRYATATLQSALQDYPTGDHHGPQVAGDTAMIVVWK